MAISEELRQEIMGQQQGALRLHIAFVGLSNGLFEAMSKLGNADAAALAAGAGVDPGYTIRWCDAAYAFGLLDETEGTFTLTPLGEAFRPDAPGTLMPAAVGAVLSAHMAERAADLMKSGERPGEKVLAERATILPWFGPMLEKSFGAMFESQILPNIPVYEDVDAKGGLAVDLGCGNGWYIRTLTAKYPNLRGIGLDGFDENIRQATERAEHQGLADRTSFRAGDIHEFNIEEQADLIAMNRAMHHVWSEKENVFRILKQHLKPGGSAVIWEPNWPQQRADLRDPSRRAMAFQNLGEHIQGNHFLTPGEIEAEFHKVGMDTQVYLFMNGNEAVVVGTKR